MTRPKRRSTPIVLAIALVLATAQVSAQSTGGTGLPGAPVQILIAAQPLADALNDWARQTRVQLIVQQTLVAGRTAPAVAGNMTARQALDRLLAGSGLVAGLDGAAVLVTQAPSSATPLSEAKTLESVVVSARRPANENIIVRRSTGGALFGEADLREIPFSVNIVGEAEIKNRQANTLSEMLATDPAIGFEYVDSGGSPFERLRIRGFTQGNQVINGQLTGLDTVSFSSALVDRVEVLRGPAAFRYGFVAPGGVINIVTKRPTTRPQASGTLLATGAGEVGAQVDLSDHFDESKRFGYRLNIRASDGASAIDTQSRRQGVIGFATDFKLTNDLTVYADFQRENIRARGGASLFPNISVATDGTLPPALNPQCTIQPEWNSYNSSSQYAGVEVDWKLFPQWRLNSAFRHGDSEDKGWGGVLFYAPFQPNGDHFLANYGYKNKYDTLSNVTYLQGTFDTGSVNHKLTVGGSFLDSKLAGFFPDNNNTVSVPSNIFTPAPLPYSAPGAYVPGFEINEKQSGAFISNEMMIGPWRPLLGLRYSKLDYAATFNSGASSTSKVAPMVALSYEASDAITIYGSYATGLENGGLAPVGTVNQNEQMAPLVTKGYEFGVKTDLLNGDITLDAALFSAQRTSAFVNASNRFVQAGRQVNKGIELTAKGRFWKPLEVSAGLVYIDAKLKDDPSIAGNRAVNVPKLSAVVYGDYSVASVSGLFLSGRMSYVSKKEYNLPNRNRVDAYTLLGLGVRYQTAFGGQNTTFRVNLDNLTNKAYWAKADAFDGLIGAPRTLKTSVDVQF